MKTYEFVIPSLYTGFAANDVGKELERIKKKYGSLKPSFIVDESRNAGDFLHDIFCWDDTKAAELYRVKQARDLIGNIHVVVTTKNINAKVRAFVNVKTEPEGHRSYHPIQDVIKNDTAYNDLLMQAKDDMESFITKYSQIEELNAVKAEMLKVLAK